MIESFDNALQIVVLLICIGITMYRATVYRSRTWTLTLLFYGSWVLGDIYWLVCLIFYGNTPQISIVSDLSWHAAYIFLYLMLIKTADPDPNSRKYFLPWLGPIFAVGMAVFFMFRGEILSNLIYAGLMGLLLFSAIYRLMKKEMYRKQQYLAILILIFCLLEYALWTASCFWKSDTLANPYYWIDVLLTISFLFFLPATRKAVIS